MFKGMRKFFEQTDPISVNENNTNRTSYIPKFRIGDTVYGYHNSRHKDVFEISKFKINKIDFDGFETRQGLVSNVFYSEDIPFNGWWMSKIPERYINKDYDALLKVLIEDSKFIKKEV